MPQDWFDQATTPKQGTRGQVFTLSNPKQAAETTNTQANTSRTVVDTRKTTEELPYVAPKAAGDAARSKAEAGMAALGINPEALDKMRLRMQAADNLQRSINEIVSKYRTGPGATKGLMGLTDLLPLPSNTNFNAASNSARASVGQSLGFAASQLNTEKEGARNVGPYIPRASDYDSGIEATIARLQGIVDEARTAAGQYGEFAPKPNVTADYDPTHLRGGAQFSINTGPGGAGGGTGPGGTGGPGGAGPTDNYGVAKPAGTQLNFSGDAVPDVGDRMSPDQEAAIAKALRDGDRGQVLAFYKQFTGNDPSQNTIASVAAAIQALKTNHNAQVGVNYGDVDARAKEQADFKRYGGQMPQALKDRAGANPADVSARGLTNGFLAGIPDYVAGAAMAPFRGGLTDSINRERALTAADQQLHPTNSFISNVVGGAGGALAGESLLARGAMKFAPKLAPYAPLAADTLYGATAGYTGADPGQGGTGALFGALAGGGGGAVGRKATEAAGAAIKGVTDPAVQYLRDKGVRLSLGQNLGGWYKGVEDRMAGMPFIGDAINGIRDRGILDYNKAGFKEQAQKAGQTAADQIGGLGVENAIQNSSKAYSSALDNAYIPTDRQTITDMIPSLRLGVSNPRFGDDFRFLVNNEVSPLASNFRKGMTGKEFQNVDRALQGLESGYGKMPEPIAAPVAQAFGGLGDALDATVARNAPDVLPAYKDAKESYRMAKVLQDTVNRAKNGARSRSPEVFMPSQLADAAAANARKFGGTQGTTQQPFYQLARAGQEVMPSKIADSGTAGRLLLPMMLAGGGEGADQGLGALGVDSEGAGLTTGLLAAGLLMPNTKFGRYALDKLVAARPAAIRKLGESVMNNRVAGGLFGASVAPKLAGPAVSGLLAGQ